MVKKKPVKSGVGKKSTSNTRTRKPHNISAVEEAQVASAPASDPAEINEMEREAIESQVQRDEEEQSHVSMKNLELAVALVEDMFNLKGKDFNVTSFKDTPTKFAVHMSNGEFDVSIVLTDKEKYGLM